MLSCRTRAPLPTSYAALQRMRSLSPLESEIVPPPDHDPGRAAKGPALCAWACVENSSAAAIVRPRHARVNDGIDRDGMNSPRGSHPNGGAFSAGTPTPNTHVPPSPLSGMNDAL